MKVILFLFTSLFLQECESKGVAIYAGAANFHHRSVFVAHGPTNPENYRTSYNVHQSSYGSQFGDKGLDSNTHIFNDNYKVYNRKFRKFLVEHLYARENVEQSKLGEWTEGDDRRWRFTTKAPYFDNRIPRNNKVLPASAVVGAATAFGLTSLLPLRVDEGKPLMYCPETDLAQDSIELNGRIYSCDKYRIRIICREEATTLNPLNSTDNVKEVCINSIDICEHLKFDDENLNCESGVLTSNSSIVCDSFEIAESTTTIKTLQCRYGELAPKLASFIPTTESSSQATTTASAQDENSFYDDVKTFFKNIWRKSTSTDEEKSDEPLVDDENNDTWLPEALVVDV